MRQIFADTFYWIALCNQRDQWHQQVVNFSQQLKGTKLVTSDAVLNELLNYYAQFGSEMRLGICPGQIRARLRPAARKIPQPDLLLGHRLRPDRPIRQPSGL